MKLATKKLIAREFLILLVCIVIGILSYFLVIPINAYYASQAEKTGKEIERQQTIKDSLIIPFNKKSSIQSDLANKYRNHFNISYTDDTNADIWGRLSRMAYADSIRYRWFHAWTKDVIDFTSDLGYDNPEKFKKFILSSLVTKSELADRDKSNSMWIEINSLQAKQNNFSDNIRNKKNQLIFSINVFFVALAIFFGLRYIFYAVKWSIRTLKSN